MEKPITLHIEELKKNLIESINTSGLPIFIIDYILKDIYTEVHSASQMQFDNDKRSYEESLIESKNDDADKK